MSLIALTLNEVKGLSKEYLRSFSNDDMTVELARFEGSNEAHMDLLSALKEHALELFGCANPLFMKFKNKIYRLRNNERINESKRIARARSKNADIDPEAFVDDSYSKDKYVQHAIVPIKFQTTILKVKDGKVLYKVDEGDKPEDGEAGLIFATLYSVSNLTPRQKNDVVTVMGFGFAQSMNAFCHDTAEVTHELLRNENSETRVLLIQYLPAVEEGNVRLLHTVGAAVFAPVQTTKHERGGKIVKLQKKKINVVNLVQIAVLPTWSRRSLGGIVMVNAVNERLQEAGYDLLIVCGCKQAFYHRSGLKGYPDWLKETPFSLPVPKAKEEGKTEAKEEDKMKAEEEDKTEAEEEDETEAEEEDATEAEEEDATEEEEDETEAEEAEQTPTREEYNRDLFFFQVLNEDKYESSITKYAKKGCQFSFEFSDYLMGYYGFGLNQTCEADENESLSAN